MPAIEPTVVNIKYAVFINDVQVQTVGDVTVNESLSSLCRVCEFELAEQPVAEPALDDTILVQFLDYDNEVAYDLFGGTAAAFEVDSEPWVYVIQATDQLEKLRRAPANDHVWTGLTVTEAMFDLLDSCNIDYDPADILDIPYVLGAEVKISWPAGTAGSDMVSEINGVFGTTLQTIGNNRVIWFFPELPPSDSTGKYRDYEKDVDADFETHHRQHGGRDEIQNLWVAEGASWPCGAGDPPECTCQPWAKSISGNSQLGGRRIRTVTQSVTSDLIQDESLAEAVVRRQMRLTNRLPDNAIVNTVNDPNVHPGTKAGLIDHTYGINTEALRLGTVISVDRTGNEMTLNMICGTPGNEGTVTHGVEKVCNDTRSDVDVPGSFDPPDFDVPPFEVGAAFGLLSWNSGIFVIGGTLNPDDSGGDPVTEDLILGIVHWVEEIATFTTSPGHVIATVGAGSFGGGWYDNFEVDPVADWSFDIIYQFTGDPSFHIGIGGSSPSNPIVGRREVLINMNALEWTAQTQGDADDTESFSGPFDEGDDILLTFAWDQSTTTFSATMIQGAHTETVSSFDPYDVGGTGPYHPFLYTFAGTGTVDISSFSVTGL